MKKLVKILARYVFSAAGIGLLMMALNILSFFGLLIALDHTEPDAAFPVRAYAAELRREGQAYTLPDEMRAALAAEYSWAMLLSDEGDVVWRDRLPASLERHYTVSDTASFSRWYLDDYPVYVYDHADGLLVLGKPQNSYWKHEIGVAAESLERMKAWVPAVLLLNLLTVLLLALLFGWRLYRSLGPLAEGIGRLSHGEAAGLPERGMLGSLSADLNRASDTLLHQREMLEKRDRTRTEWIAGVSHDVRTPLAVVQGEAAQLEADTALPASAREKAARIRAQSQRMGRLVSDLNLASKLTYELQPLSRVRFRPAALLRRAAADALNEEGGGRVTAEVDIPPGLGDFAVQGDETLLARAAGNLLRNSIEHNAGAVCISLSLSRTADTYTMIVQDDGTGLPDDVLDSLRRPAPEALPAHGLGLLLVSRIAAAHGGVAFWQNTAPGVRAVLTLPIAPP